MFKRCKIYDFLTDISLQTKDINQFFLILKIISHQPHPTQFQTLLILYRFYSVVCFTLFPVVIHVEAHQSHLFIFYSLSSFVSFEHFVKFQPKLKNFWRILIMVFCLRLILIKEQIIGLGNQKTPQHPLKRLTHPLPYLPLLTLPRWKFRN